MNSAVQCAEIIREINRLLSLPLMNRADYKKSATRALSERQKGKQREPKPPTDVADWKRRFCAPIIAKKPRINEQLSSWRPVALESRVELLLANKIFAPATRAPKLLRCAQPHAVSRGRILRQAALSWNNCSALLQSGVLFLLLLLLFQSWKLRGRRSSAGVS